KVAELVWFL
nr:Chain C, HIV-based altered-peptide ligand KVAELVWFL [Homo sapiens]3V5K_F Chain F, HIV-based altered-peptide ligand KVAELVWFL [Homo sapiens]